MREWNKRVIRDTCTHSDAAETAVKARREIADYMKSGRIERARIRVSSAVAMCAVSVSVM